MKDILVWGVILLCGMIIAYERYSHYKEIKSVTAKYEDELDTMSKRHQGILDKMKSEYNRVEALYEIRAKEVTEFQKRQEKIMEDNQRLEKLSKEKPKLVEKILNKSFDKYMGEVYNETHSNTDSRN